MTLLLGLVMVFGLVFGGFMLSGGNMDIVLYALPYEGMMIGGASLGAFVIANSFAPIDRTHHGNEPKFETICESTAMKIGRTFHPFP